MLYTKQFSDDNNTTVIKTDKISAERYLLLGKRDRHKASKQLNKEDYFRS